MIDAGGLNIVSALRWLVGPAVALILSWGALGCTTDVPADRGSTDAAGTQPAPEATQSAGADVPGVADGSIVFGQSAAFSGPASELGRNMRLGIEAAFHEVNQQGGVHGRRLGLMSRDDAYEPEAAIANTQHFINEEPVFALIGAVGTPTSRSAVPVASEAGIPYIAPFTGAAFLRDSAWGNVINLRASYKQETEEMVERLTTDLGIERIGILYQDDSYGRAGYVGTQEALKRRSMELAGVGVYRRNTSAVKTALLDLRESAPEAVIIIGAYQPVASFIAWGRQIGFDPLFLNVSFVGSHALAQELGTRGAGVGVVVTQVVPFPTDADLPVAAVYRRALLAYDPEAEPGFVSFEGYLAGRLAIISLESCGREVSRACFLERFDSSEVIDIEGFTLGYGMGDNQGSDKVFLTAIGRDGDYYPAATLKDVQR